MKKRSKVESLADARKKAGKTAEPWRATGVSIAFVPRPKRGIVHKLEKKK